SFSRDWSSDVCSSDLYRARTASLVAEESGRALAQPFAHGALLRAAAGLAEPPRQLVVVASDRSGALAAAARRADADVLAIVSPRSEESRARQKERDV